MKTTTRSSATLSILFVVFFVGLLFAEPTEAIRRMPKESSGGGGEKYLSYTNTYENAMSALSGLMARLSGGPSPKGPGH
ncbi:hypothetical protein KFK09_024375 [Dendrobium nobile]|uniref:Uncharacterized protein n=1 Tax=Dendrobium nobile TaxID=94219 RepID=A0A8T3ADW1_DENNO|nr:hypothetical protein KFK09_024375 [Dendrobium nobile]